MQLTLHKKKHRQIIPGEHDLDEKFITCPFCGSALIRKLGLISAIPEIRIMSCRQCHFGFIDRQPKESFLKEFYAGYYSRDHRQTTIEPGMLANHLIRVFEKLKPKSEYAILDFGGGDGAVARRLADHLLGTGIDKVTIFIVDYNTEEGHSTESVHQVNVQTLDMIAPGKKFDLVIASAILEHVKDPRQTIMRLLESLDANGLFYARTPYMYPIYRLLNGFGLSLDLPYPAHLSDIGNSFWNSMLKTLDLSSGYRLERSHTSLVESEFGKHPLRTLIATLFKIPSYLFKNRYPFVGGWEVVVRRES